MGDNNQAVIDAVKILLDSTDINDFKYNDGIVSFTTDLKDDDSENKYPQIELLGKIVALDKEVFYFRLPAQEYSLAILYGTNENEDKMKLNKSKIMALDYVKIKIDLVHVDLNHEFYYYEDGYELSLDELELDDLEEMPF